MGRGGRAFRQHWHERQLNLGDGGVLRWLVIDRPDREPFIAYYRSDRRGGVHETEGHRLLVEHGHADAALGLRGATMSRPAFH